MRESESPKASKAKCPACGKTVTVTASGTLRQHKATATVLNALGRPMYYCQG